MPPRALRKMQRQQEQDRLAALGKAPAEQGAEGDESDEEIQPATVRQKSPFAILGEFEERSKTEAQPAKPTPTSTFALLGDHVDEDDHDVQGDEASERSQEEDESAVPAYDQTKAAQEQVSSNQAKAKKKKKSKKDKKKAKATNVNAAAAESGKSSQRADMDDIDEALNELRIQNERKSKADSTQTGLPTQLQEFYELLSVDSRNLKVLNEMKRLFGSSVLEGENDGGAGTGRRRGRGPQQLDLGAALDRRNNPISRGQGLSERLLRKNIFIQGKDSWVKETGGGLGMEVVEQAEDFTTEYRYVHSLPYQRSQREFDVCVESMDPQRMIYFLQMNPYHISGLLQVGEIARQHQEPAVGVDLVERALFSFGRAAHSSFSTAIAEGRARMDFRRPENRELWLAGWRYVRSLGQRGTWRTAYEWAKLLFSLDPEYDPYQVRLVIDQLAIRAGQFEQLIRLAKIDPSTLDWGQNHPNIRISLALAHDRLKQGHQARAVLADAVQNYPWIIARLLKELDIDRIPKSVWGKEPRTPREELHTSAYTTRAKDLWNTPEAVSLLVEVAETTEALPSLPPPDTTEIDLNEARHILLDETPSLIGLLPHSFTNIRTSASDPLPPEDNVASYNTSYLDPRYDSSEDPTDSDGSVEQAEIQGLRGWANRMIAALTGSAAANVAAEANEGTAQASSGDERHVDRQARAREQAMAQEQLLAEQEDAMLAEAIRRSQAEMAGRVSGESEREAEADDEVGVDTRAVAEEETHPSVPAVSAHAEPSREPEVESNDPQRAQRWLAGRGLLALKDFVSEHGAQEGNWGFGLDDERASPVREYVARAKALNQQQRRFILDFALPQGAGREAGETVKRLVGR